MKVATFNTNSIRARLPIIIDWLVREQPDMLLVQETKVQDKDFPVDAFDDAGYQVAFRGQKSYNGVAIISRSPLQDVVRNLYEGEDEEARFISGRIGDLPVINVYVPQGLAPGTEKFHYKLRWMEMLLSHLERKYNAGDPLLVAGDFNVALEPIDLFDPEGYRGEAGYHPDEQKLMRRFFDWGLVDLFRKQNPGGGHYTFWDYRIPNGFKRNMGWRIDYILATAPLVEKCTRVWIDTEPRAKPKPSDHTFLIAEFNRG